MPNPHDATRRQRVLDYLATRMPGTTQPLSSIIVSILQPDETSDSSRWTSLLSALVTEGLVEVSGSYRKRYALASRSDTSPSEELHGGLNVVAMLPPRLDDTPPLADPAIDDIVAESMRLESEAKPVLLDMLTGVYVVPSPDYASWAQYQKDSLKSCGELATRGLYDPAYAEAAGHFGEQPQPAEPPPHLPSGVAFDRGRQRFVHTDTGYGPGPYFAERWWSQRDRFPPWGESPEAAERRQHDRLVEPEALEVFRAAVLIRAANTGWGIDAGLDADVREARALLAEARRQVREAAPVGEHYTEQHGHTAY